MVTTVFRMPSKAKNVPEDGETDQSQDDDGVKEIWGFYKSSASIHGVAHVGGPSLYSFRRWLWLVLVISMATGLCVILVKQVQRLASFPTRTSIRADFETDVPFPAVTLCNLNQFFRSRVPDDPGLRYLIRLSSEYSSLINDSAESTAPPPLNPVIPNPWRPPDTGTTANTSNTHSTSPPPQTYVWSNITGPELSRVVWNAAHRKSEFLYLCAWNSQKIPCDEVFEERMTDLGVCFTFNGKSPRRKRRRSSTFGSWTGLRVLMIVDQDQYYFAKTMQTGVKVVLHEPDHEPMPTTSGMSIRPGVSAHLAFKRTEHLGLSAPYKAYKNEYCLDTHAEDYQHKLLRHSFYSEVACYRDCVLESIVTRCNCTSPFEPELKRPVCSVDQMIDCYIPISEAFTLQFLNRCECRPPCQRVIYDITASYADFASDFMEQVMNKRRNMSEEQYLRNVVDMRVFLESLLVIRVHQEPETTLAEILGTLGGHLGLFLGASILSITELTELLLLLLLRCFGCLRGTRRRTERSDTQSKTDGSVAVATVS